MSDNPDTSDYLAAEEKAQAAGEPPQPAPDRPVTAASPRNAALRTAHGAHVQPAAQRIGTRARPPAPPPLAPLAALQIYPQQINHEFLMPMTRVINDAVAAGNLNGIRAFALRINPELAAGLMRRARAAESVITGGGGGP